DGETAKASHHGPDARRVNPQGRSDGAEETTAAAKDASRSKFVGNKGRLAHVDPCPAAAAPGRRSSPGSLAGSRYGCGRGQERASVDDVVVHAPPRPPSSTDPHVVSPRRVAVQ